MKTILIAEDEKINREILRGFINQLGHQVIEAVDGKEALACIQKNPPDLIMLDIMMPVMDGFEVMKDLKSRETTQDIPVIVTSALGEKSDVVKGIKLGADDYLIKPFSSVILKARINNCLKKKEHFDKEKRLRKELDQSYQALKEVEQLRDALMHMVVHDLRSPLSGILSNLQLLQLDSASGFNQNQLDILTTVEKATMQLNRMINSIMDLSKIESGKMHLNLQLIDIRMVIEGLLSQYSSLVEDHDLQMEVIFPKDTIWLQGDQAILIRVFENLLFNALKYARTRIKIEVTTSVEGFCVRFSDDGPGIPDEFRGRIFDKYFQVSDQRAQKTRSGFGLGLAFCKMAVETHQGTIRLDTNHDLGTAFIIQLPKLDPKTYTDPSVTHKAHTLVS